MCRKFEYPELQEFNGKLCTIIYRHETSRFAEKLNIQNCVNSMGNCVQCMHILSGFAEKLNIMYCIYLTENCEYYICMECLDLQRN